MSVQFGQIQIGLTKTINVNRQIKLIEWK